MNKLMKRALILSIFVLCLFALTLLGASAEATVTNGVTEKAEGTTYVASFDLPNGDETSTTYYYVDLNTAITEAVANSVDTVSLHASVTAAESMTVTSANGITIKRAEGFTDTMFVITGGDFVINNVTVDFGNATTYGKVFDISGTASLTIGDADDAAATTLTGVMGGQIVYVSAELTGNITVNSDATLTYTAVVGDTVYSMIDAQFAVNGALTLNGAFYVGTESAKLELTANYGSGAVLLTNANITEITIGGEIYCYSNNSYTIRPVYLNYNNTGTITTLNVSGSVYSNNASSLISMKAVLSASFNGATLTMESSAAPAKDQNSNYKYCGLVYVAGSSTAAKTVTVNGGMWTVSHTTHSIPLMYNGDDYLTIEFSGSPVLNNHCEVKGDYNYATFLAATNATTVKLNEGATVNFTSTLGHNFFEANTVQYLSYNDAAALEWTDVRYKYGTSETGKVGAVYFETLAELAAVYTLSDFATEVTILVAGTTYADDAEALAAGMLYRVGDAGGNEGDTYFDNYNAAVARTAGTDLTVTVLTSPLTREQAQASGLRFQVGDGAGDIGTVYFNTLAEAIAAAVAADNATVYVLNDATVTATITLDNLTVTLVGIANGGVYPTITFTGTTTGLFSYTPTVNTESTLSVSYLDIVTSGYLVHITGSTKSSAGTIRTSFTRVNVTSAKSIYWAQHRIGFTLYVTIDDSVANGSGDDSLLWSANNGSDYLFGFYTADSTSDANAKQIYFDLNDITLKAGTCYVRTGTIGSATNPASYKNVTVIGGSARSICMFGTSKAFLQLDDCNVNTGANPFLHFGDTCPATLTATNTNFTSSSEYGIFCNRRTTTYTINLTGGTLTNTYAGGTTQDTGVAITPGSVFLHFGATSYTTTWNVTMTDVKVNAKFLYADYRNAEYSTYPVVFNATLNNVQNVGSATMGCYLTDATAGNIVIKNSPSINITVTTSENVSYKLDDATAVGLLGAVARVGELDANGLAFPSAYYTTLDLAIAATPESTVSANADGEAIVTAKNTTTIYLVQKSTIATAITLTNKSIKIVGLSTGTLTAPTTSSYDLYSKITTPFYFCQNSELIFENVRYYFTTRFGSVTGASSGASKDRTVADKYISGDEYVHVSLVNSYLYTTSTGGIGIYDQNDSAGGTFVFDMDATSTYQTVSSFTGTTSDVIIDMIRLDNTTAGLYKSITININGALILTSTTTSKITDVRPISIKATGSAGMDMVTFGENASVAITTAMTPTAHCGACYYTSSAGVVILNTTDLTLNGSAMTLTQVTNRTHVATYVESVGEAYGMSLKGTAQDDATVVYFYATTLTAAFVASPTDTHVDLYILNDATLSFSGTLTLPTARHITLIGSGDPTHTDITSSGVLALSRDTTLILKNLRYETSYRFVAISDELVTSDSVTAGTHDGTEAAGTTITLQLVNSYVKVTGAIGIYVRNQMAGGTLSILIDADSTIEMENAAPSYLFACTNTGSHNMAQGSKMTVAGTIKYTTTSTAVENVFQSSATNLVIEIAASAVFDITAESYRLFYFSNDNSGCTEFTVITGLEKPAYDPFVTENEDIVMHYTYLSDACAVSYGCLYRVGEIPAEGGALGTVYFARLADLVVVTNNSVENVTLLVTIASYATDDEAKAADMQFRVGSDATTGGAYGWVYFDIIEEAQAMAKIMGSEIVYINILQNVDQAIAAGAVVRLGAATDEGKLDVNYFKTIADAIAAAVANGDSEVTLYLLQTGTESETVVLTGITVTLDTVEDKTRVLYNMNGDPAFSIGGGATLIVKNVHIVCDGGFAQFANNDTATTAQLDFESGALVEVVDYQSGTYFVRPNGSAVGIVLINVKNGAELKLSSDGTETTTQNIQGMFNFVNTQGTVATGSTFNIDGKITYKLIFASSFTDGGRSAMFKLDGQPITVNVTANADLQLLHENVYVTTWNAFFCITNVATKIHVNGGSFTANEKLCLVAFNGNAPKATVLIENDPTFTFAGDSSFLIYDYRNLDDASTSNDYCTVPVTVRNVRVTTATLMRFNCMTNLVLANVSFATEEKAIAEGAVMRMGTTAGTGYFNSFHALSLADITDSVYVLKSFEVVTAASADDSYARFEDQSFTLYGNGFTINNTSGGRIALFEGSCHITLNGLTVTTTANSFAFNNKTTNTAEASSSLTLVNTDIAGTVGANQNALLLVGGNNSVYFDLTIDADSSIGYTGVADRNAQVIFYYGSITGDIVIHGRVYAEYTVTGNIDYTVSSGIRSGVQYMMDIGGSVSKTFTGDIIITGTLEMNVTYPAADGTSITEANVQSHHVSYALKLYKLVGNVFIADSATVSNTCTNASTLSDSFNIQNNKSFTMTCSPVISAATLSGTAYSSSLTLAVAFLQENGHAQAAIGTDYRVVYEDGAYFESPGVAEQSHGTAYSYTASEELAALLSTLLGVESFGCVSDAQAAQTYEILVGLVDRDVKTSFLPMMDVNEYGILIRDGKILLLAWHNAALQVCVTQFKTLLNAIASNNTVTLPTGFSIIGVANTAWKVDFVRPADTTLTAGQYVNDTSLQFLYTGTGATNAAFLTYCAQLVDNGYVLVWANTEGANEFRLYQNETTGIALYVAYNDFTYKGVYETTDALTRDYQKCIRIVSSPITAITIPDATVNSRQDYTYVADSKLTMIGVGSDTVSSTDENGDTTTTTTSNVGMGYVIRLEDGRFVVIDGGNTHVDADQGSTYDQAIAIYNVLAALYQEAYGTAPTTEQPIHIAAWLLTHAHADHYHAFSKMLQLYGSTGLIKMDYMLANLPDTYSSYNMGTSTSWGFASKSSIATLQGYLETTGGFEFIKVHTGQKLYFANLEIEILMTYEDHLPFAMQNSNDSCVISRFTFHSSKAITTASDVTVLFLADAWRMQSRFLCAMYGTALQTQIVQLAHHGNVGCEIALYDLIQPKAVIFPNKGSAMVSYSFWETNPDSTKSAEGYDYTKIAYRYDVDKYVVQQLESVQYVFAAVADTYYTMTFTSTGIDFDAIYDVLTGSTIAYNQNEGGTGKSYFIKYTDRIGKLISITIVWGDLSFTYVFGEWDPTTHTYEGGGWRADGDSTVTVENAGDVSVNIALTFTTGTGYGYFSGAFTENGTAVAAGQKLALDTATSRVFTFSLTSSSVPDGALDHVVIGSITLTVTEGE